MEAVYSSETSVNFYQSTCHHIPEEGILHAFVLCLDFSKGRTWNESKRDQCSVENIWTSGK
jgi:hypothetical protein